MDDVQKKIDQIVKDEPIVLFMKGTRFMPQCGFSAKVVGILDEFLDEYVTVNVLEDPAVRQGIKDYSSWPTIPQLYVKGEFVGGCDIVAEMMESGEISEVLEKEMKPVPDPEVFISDEARSALNRFTEGDREPQVRLQIDRAFQYGMDFDEARPSDVVVRLDGLTLLLDRASARRADGLCIDYVERPDGGGFKIDNPNEPPKVRPMPVRELAVLMKAGKPMEVFDVRTVEEREKAKIDGTRLLDQEAKEMIEGFERDAVLVFICHHGQRSRAAAEHYLRMGFRNVYNVVGGIDAWSLEVDGDVPRY